MTLYKWSHNASDNATADASINYQEGQAPSTLNDSARAAMAAIAKFRDDISGGTVTDASSSGTAYVVFSNQGFDTLAHMDKQVVGFTPSVTNTGAVTLNVDTLGAKPLRSAPNTALVGGVLVAGTPYAAVYNNTDGCFYLCGYFVQPSLVPVGCILDSAVATLPNSSFAFANGQAVSRTTYSGLYALIGTTYGAGDGSTTFNLPDLRGRVSAGPDNMGGAADANRLTNSALTSVRTSLGGAGGESTHTQTVAEMPAHSHTANVSDPGHSHSVNGPPNVWYAGGAANIGGSPNTNFLNYGAAITVNAAVTGINVSINNNGSGNAFNVMQPTLLLNKIIRLF